MYIYIVQMYALELCMCSSLLMITCSYSAHRRLQVYRAEKQELQIRWGSFS